MIRATLSAIAAALLLAAATSGPADAIGSGRSLLQADSDIDRAAALIEAERYEEALDLLAVVAAREPENADAFNYIGFANRKLGRYDMALDNYARALALDPAHRGALEYQGEAFLELGDVAAAEANLATLRRLCPDGCEERDELAAAIAEHRAGAPDPE